MEMNTSGTVWSITINNPSERDRENIAHPPDWVKSIKGQDEEAPTTGTLHFQGCLKTKYTEKFKKIKMLFPTANISRARNALALEQYVCKTETAVPGTFTESTGEESKRYIAPSSYLRIMADNLIELLGDAPIVIKNNGKELTINIDCIQNMWWSVPPEISNKTVSELVYDRMAKYMVQEGYYIELYAIDKKFKTAWHDFGLDILRSAGFLDKLCPHSGSIIFSE